MTPTKTRTLVKTMFASRSFLSFFIANLRAWLSLDVSQGVAVSRHFFSYKINNVPLECSSTNTQISLSAYVASVLSDQFQKNEGHFQSHHPDGYNNNYVRSFSDRSKRIVRSRQFLPQQQRNDPTNHVPHHVQHFGRGQSFYSRQSQRQSLSYCSQPSCRSSKRTKCEPIRHQVS